MKCFILKTQADPSKEPYGRHVSSLTAVAEHWRGSASGQRAAEASDAVLEAALLSFHTVCGLELNVNSYCGHLPSCASLVFIA